MLPSISFNDRDLLVKLFNSFLSEMVKREASDIEVGGYGSNDSVWFRVYGKKNPIEELPKLNYDESALLVLSILNEKQRKILEENRNLDFSYTFDYSEADKFEDNNDVSEIRFRGDAYFDVDRLAMNMRSIIPKLRTLEELEFHSNALKTLSYNYIKQGLILITGVTDRKSVV